MSDENVVQSDGFTIEASEKAKIMQRFHRAAGQLEAVKNMIEENKPVNQVLIQLQATISALQSIKIEVVQQQVRQNILEEIKKAFQIIK